MLIWCEQVEGSVVEAQEKSQMHFRGGEPSAGFTESQIVAISGEHAKLNIEEQSR